MSKRSSFFSVIVATAILIVLTMPMSSAQIIVGDQSVCNICNSTEINSSGIKVAITPTERTKLLEGYKIAVINGGTYAASNLEAGLDALGADADLINPEDITVTLLSNYDLVWIPYGGASAVDSAGKSDEILSYVYNGGGLILTQPNEVGTPQCLPYEWQITDISYTDPCAATIVYPDHPLTAGLTVDDMPDCYDTIGYVDSNWTILALSGAGQPSFACAEYGSGRIIVEMDAPYPCSDICGDNPNLPDVTIQRMVSWVSQSTPTLPTPTPPPEQGNATWTFMVYLDGDNDLDSAALDDLNEMMSVGSTEYVNIVVLLDRYSEGAKLYYVEQGSTVELADWGEVNMGDPQTLINFVNYVVTNYPAEHYALILWNHGSGWKKNESVLTKGVIFDDTNYDYLTMDELEYALEQIKNDIDRDLDIIGFDACLMGMVEVDYTIYKAMPTAIRVGSEECEPWDGWPYDMILQELTANPSMSPEDLATVIVNDYVDSYGEDSEVTQSAVYVSSCVYPVLNDFVNAIMSANDHDAVAQAMTQVERMYCYNEYADLYHFAELVATYTSNTTVQNYAYTLMNAINDSIIVESHGSYHMNIHGISIYLPYSVIDPKYYNISFAEDNLWDEFLGWAVYWSPPEPQWTVLTSDSVNEAYPDISTVYVNTTADAISFKVKLNTPVTELYGLWGLTMLDVDQDSWTGAPQNWWWFGNVSVGAEYAVAFDYYTGYMKNNTIKHKIDEHKKVFLKNESKSVYAGLYVWNEENQTFDWLADISAYLNATDNSIWFSIPTSLINDSDCCMNVQQYVKGENYTTWGYDLAPNQGYAVVGEDHKPDIWVDPASLSVTLSPNATYTTTITVGNDGNNILRFIANISVTGFPMEVLFYDDVESGEDSWTYDGLWHITEHRYSSPTHSWYYGQENVWNYDTGSANSGSLTTPPISLENVTSAYLIFDYWYQTETTGPYWDQRWIMVSVDGNDFQPIEQLYNDEMNTWHTKVIDLTPFVGHTIQLRFYFDTIDDILNDFEGWYIDDIAVVSVGGVLNVTPNYEIALQPGEQTQLTVNIDTTGLDIGNYYGNITIYSNDPDEGVITIPVELVVSTTPPPPENEWSVSITATSETWVQDLVFGVNASATDGFDSDVDVPSPPLPPGATKYAYFQIDDPIFPMLLQDYRPIINQSNPSETWELVVASDEEITLTWDADVPAVIANLTMSYDNTTLDMRSQSSLTLPAGTYTIYITAEYDLEPPVIYNMQPSENIYNPSLPTEVTISANYSDNVGIDVSSVVLTVNGNDVTDQATVTDTGISYTFMADEGTYTVYLEVSDIAGNVANVTWSFEVSPCVTVNIPLKQGWNMISLPVMNATFDIPGTVVQYAYWYNPQTQSYEYVSITEIEPGKGYWVAAIQDCNITVTGIPLTEYSVNLTQGWNMIGSLIVETDFSSPQTNPPNSVLPYAYWYDPVTQSYTYSTTLEPTKGYWVAATQDCQLIVQLTPPPPPQ